jgi:hypothetical protein
MQRGSPVCTAVDETQQQESACGPFLTTKQATTAEELAW